MTYPLDREGNCVGVWKRAVAVSETTKRGMCNACSWRGAVTRSDRYAGGARYPRRHRPVPLHPLARDLLDAIDRINTAEFPTLARAERILATVRAARALDAPGVADEQRLGRLEADALAVRLDGGGWQLTPRGRFLLYREKPEADR